MSQDFALGFEATRSGTRVGALLVDARLIAGTVGVEDAFGSTVGRCTDVILEARAGWMVADHLAAGVRTARGWQARWRPFGGFGVVGDGCSCEISSEG